MGNGTGTTDRRRLWEQFQKLGSVGEVIRVLVGYASNCWKEELDIAGRVNRVFDSNSALVASEVALERIGEIMAGVEATPFVLVEEFMTIAGQSFSNWGKDGSIPDYYGSLRQLRTRLLAEEADEYFEGERDDDLVQIMDGLADVIVVAYGTMLSYVGPVAANRILWNVGQSNLSKFNETPEGLVAVKREDGKVLKGDRYWEPEIESILRQEGFI